MAENIYATNQFRLAIEASPTGMIMVDQNGVIVLINMQIEKLFGYSRNELIGKKIEILVPDRFKPNHPEFRENFFSSPHTRPMGAGRDLFGLRKDKTEVPVEIGLNPFQISDESFVLCSVVDITERVRASEQFRLAIEAAPTGMIMVDELGKIVMVNVETEKLFGYSRDELIGQPIEILVPLRLRDRHPAYRATFANAPHARAMGEGRDLYGLCKNGNEIPVEIGLNPLHTSTGNFVLSSIVDITERKQAEKQRETLLQEIHHRVKNNLQVISSLINMKLKQHQDRNQEDLEECLTRIQAIALIHEMLYQSADYITVPFYQYIRELADGIFRSIGTEHDNISIEFNLEEINLNVDKAIPFGLIINELITNSIKHAFPNDHLGVISIGLHTVGADEFCLDVKDNGIGISTEIDFFKTKSLGMQLIGDLADQVKARTEVNFQNGTSFKFIFQT